MKSMKDYHDLYLKSDMLLLAGVFGKKQKKELWITLNVPGLSWDAMLKMSQKLFHTLRCIYSLRKVPHIEFLIFLIHAAKPTINIYIIMIKKKNRNILYTQT